MKNENGFTLIELTVVIVLLGILSVVAIPIYNDMRDQAALTNVKGVGAAISSASLMNHSATLIKR